MSIFRIEGNSEDLHVMVLIIPGSWRLIGFGPELRAELKAKTEEQGTAFKLPKAPPYPPPGTVGYLN